MLPVSFKGTFCISSPVLTEKNREKIMKKYDKYQMKFNTLYQKKDFNETLITVPDSCDGNMKKLLDKLDIPHYYFNRAASLDKNEIRSRIVMDELDKMYGLSMVEVDVEKLDKMLSIGKYYVGYKALIGGSKEKYSNFQDYLHTKHTIEPPKVSLTKADDGTIIPNIDDGRHRFAVLRDMGFKKLPVRMNKDSIALAIEIELI